MDSQHSARHVSHTPFLMDEALADSPAADSAQEISLGPGSSPERDEEGLEAEEGRLGQLQDNANFLGVCSLPLSPIREVAEPGHLQAKEALELRSQGTAGNVHPESGNWTKANYSHWELPPQGVRDRYLELRKAFLTS